MMRSEYLRHPKQATCLAVNTLKRALLEIYIPGQQLDGISTSHSEDLADVHLAHSRC
jgi:hypothetical protein